MLVMESFNETWQHVIQNYSHQTPSTGTRTEEDLSSGRLTYGGFISMLQKLGVNHHAVRAPRLGMPIGKGSYFRVYRHMISASDYQSMNLIVSLPREPLFHRPCPGMNTVVALKRIKVEENTAEIDISNQGQMQAICREIAAMVHPRLRDHESIVKLQAIIWENGLGAGNESDLPMWPSLVMEYCDTTLAEYQTSSPQLTMVQTSLLGSKIGEGLDALHSVNIFHGDVKSENILLKVGKDGTLEPKLADFGCSVSFLDENGKTRYRVTGTPMWWAPECPNYFTAIDDIAATDWYSFGLLLLRMHAHGRNPFEEFGVIPFEYSPDEKLQAVQFMKETDCIYALVCGNHEFDDLPQEIRILAAMLIKDPAERIEKMELLDIRPDMVLSAITEKEIKQDAEFSRLQNQIGKISGLMEHFKLEEEAGDSTLLQEEADIPDPLSMMMKYFGKAQIPDCTRLATVKGRAALNTTTMARVIRELTLVLEEDSMNVYPNKCSECCRLTKLDKDPSSLCPDTLISELQRMTEAPQNEHVCLRLLGLDAPPHEIEVSTALGSGQSSASARKSEAVLQLFLATASGYGTRKDPRRALEILEQAAASGLRGLCVYAYFYSMATNQALNQNLPIRTWLVSLILFSAGIPSGTFSALMQLDPPLAELAAKARSKVYNGSTASFENLKFNSLQPEFNTSTGFYVPEGEQYLVQDELFENTLLHLAAGSDGENLPTILHCINVLGIDINVRNSGGATPLLLACRAGREANILALLKHGAKVNLSYEAGETPLHWLGLLPDPSRVLDEFLKRGADINAQVTRPRLLPNYIHGTLGFFFAGGPLVWAMAMESHTYVDALLNRGVDIYHPGPTGLTAISVACRPRLSRFLTRLSLEENFRVTSTDAYKILINWGEMHMIIHSSAAKEQEEALELILSHTKTWDSAEEVTEFYRYLVPKAISQCRIELLEIVLRGLGRDLGAVWSPNQDLEVYVKSPLLHPFWTNQNVVHDAASRGDKDILKAVLSSGGDAADIDGSDWTTLHMLSFYSDNPDCVDLLISHGALRLLDNRIKGGGLSAFMNAAASCNFKVADRLLHYTPAGDRKDMLCSHPMRGMVIPGVSMIGHYVAWSPFFGDRPLEYLFNLPEICENRASIFIVEETHRLNVFMIACGIHSDGAIWDAEFFAESRRRRVYNFLIQKFPEARYINAKDTFNNTALHFAAMLGNFDMAATLMDNGAELNPVNDAGASPLDILFTPDPGFLLHEKSVKSVLIEHFEKGRNDIYVELKSRGGVHNLQYPNGRTPNVLPRPQVREQPLNTIEHQEQGTV